MNLYISYLDEFKNIIKSDKGIVLLDEPMKKHTSFKVGGPVDIMVIPGSHEELQKSIKLCIKESIPYLIIGNGSNLLVKDKGIRGVVIKLTAINDVKVEDTRIIAGGGALLSDVSEIALEHRLAGFEFACGIPGCIGGAVAMNAGAYGGQIDSVLENVLIIDKKGEFQRLNKEQLELGYRSSAILKYDYSVVEAVFKFEKGEYAQIKEAIDDLQGRRRDKQPLEFPSAGSTFKRPEGYFAGKLIEDSGLKGVKLGGAQVSQKHSGFIINTGDATAGDVLALIAHVQKTVFDKFGVELHTEVRIIGED